MISRNLMALLMASAVLAWISQGDEEVQSSARKPSYSARTQPPAAPETSVLVTGKPWQRFIMLPAIEPMELAIEEPTVEPAPLPPVELPPPEPPSAPPLPVTYLGQIKDKNTRSLFIRYQEQPMSIKAGELLGDDYRLETVTADHALFRYLPLDAQQELRWDDQ